jgi:plastocyanin
MFTKGNKILLSILLPVVFSANASAGETEIGQLNKAFIQGSDDITTIDIKVGDTLRFKNYDPFNHNVFSNSKAATFDLGSFPKGQSREVIFDKPGEVKVQCAIHPEMKMIVNVK